jgi:hypothetical protein
MKGINEYDNRASQPSRVQQEHRHDKNHDGDHEDNEQDGGRNQAQHQRRHGGRDDDDPQDEGSKDKDKEDAFKIDDSLAHSHWSNRTSTPLNDNDDDHLDDPFFMGANEGNAKTHNIDNDLTDGCTGGRDPQRQPMATRSRTGQRAYAVDDENRGGRAGVRDSQHRERRVYVRFRFPE